MSLNKATVILLRHTRDLQRMRRFYEHGLGLRPVQSWDRPGNQGVVLAFDPATSAMRIELLALGELAIPDMAPVNVELSLEVQDVTAVLHQLEMAGIPIARSLEDTGWGHRSFGVDDPDGLRLWIYQVIEPA